MECCIKMSEWSEASVTAAAAPGGCRQRRRLSNASVISHVTTRNIKGGRLNVSEAALLPLHLLQLVCSGEDREGSNLHSLTFVLKSPSWLFHTHSSFRLAAVPAPVRPQPALTASQELHHVPRSIKASPMSTNLVVQWQHQFIPAHDTFSPFCFESGGISYTFQSSMLLLAGLPGHKSELHLQPLCCFSDVRPQNKTTAIEKPLQRNTWFGLLQILSILALCPILISRVWDTQTGLSHEERLCLSASVHTNVFQALRDKARTQRKDRDRAATSQQFNCI